MYCAQFTAGRCRSCEWLDKTYPQQLADKQRNLKNLLTGQVIAHWLPPIYGSESAFRNKAKMVVSGSVERPLLGVLHSDGTAVDLCSCPLYPASFSEVFDVTKVFIARAGLTPYNVVCKRGELKYLLLTESTYNGELMLRFVLRSEVKLSQIKVALPWLQQQLPQLAVISVNIQPVHMAVLEGEQEILLTCQQALTEKFNHIPLYICPQSFFQTNPQVATLLYAKARDWVKKLNINSMWDLFCGVGGFGLHCANQQTHLTGIEISMEAISCARQSAKQLGLKQVNFAALDSSLFATTKTQIPQLILVNPPRRGISERLCAYLNKMAPHYILYSSCNALSMNKDIQMLSGYSIDRVQMFDMFPHTRHYEVLTLLVRNKEALTKN